MMARSKRDNLKRQMAQIVNHQAKVITTIAEVQAEFQEHHPDMAGYLEKCALNENATRDAILALVEKAWLLDENALMSFV